MSSIIILNDCVNSDGKKFESYKNDSLISAFKHLEEINKINDKNEIINKLFEFSPAINGSRGFYNCKYQTIYPSVMNRIIEDMREKLGKEKDEARKANLQVKNNAMEGGLLLIKIVGLYVENVIYGEVKPSINTMVEQCKKDLQIDPSKVLYNSDNLKNKNTPYFLDRYSYYHDGVNFEHVVFIASLILGGYFDHLTGKQAEQRDSFIKVFSTLLFTLLKDADSLEIYAPMVYLMFKLARIYFLNGEYNYRYAESVRTSMTGLGHLNVLDPCVPIYGDTRISTMDYNWFMSYFGFAPRAQALTSTDDILWWNNTTCEYATEYLTKRMIRMSTEIINNGCSKFADIVSFMQSMTKFDIDIRARFSKTGQVYKSIIVDLENYKGIDEDKRDEAILEDLKAFVIARFNRLIKDTSKGLKLGFLKADALFNKYANHKIGITYTSIRHTGEKDDNGKEITAEIVKSHEINLTLDELEKILMELSRGNRKENSTVEKAYKKYPTRIRMNKFIRVFDGRFGKISRYDPCDPKPQDKGKKQKDDNYTKWKVAVKNMFADFEKEGETDEKSIFRMRFIYANKESRAARKEEQQKREEKPKKEAKDKFAPYTPGK